MIASFSKNQREYQNLLIEEKESYKCLASVQSSQRCLEQALLVIQWYGWRRKIEQLFVTLKKAGLNIEATQIDKCKDTANNFSNNL